MVSLYISCLALGLVVGVIIGFIPYVYRLVHEGSVLV